MLFKLFLHRFLGGTEKDILVLFLSLWFLRLKNGNKRQLLIPLLVRRAHYAVADAPCRGGRANGSAVR